MNDENSKLSVSTRKPSRQRYIILVVILLLCVLVVFVFRTVSWNNVDSEYQKRSKKIICDSASMLLEKSAESLTDDDFAKIEIFTPGTEWIFQAGQWSPYSSNLSDIKLLDKFINLRELTLSNMTVPEDALPQSIQFMAKIGIDRRQNYLIDLSPLEKLPNLIKLNLSNTSFKDIRTITGIKNLQELNISNTLVSNLKPIKKLKNLNLLNIQNCNNVTDKEIEDLQKALPKLKIKR